MSIIGSLAGIGGNAFKALPVVGNIASGAAALLGVRNLIKDVMANGPDPARLEAITKARDARAEQIMGATPNMSRQAALNAANEELKPFMDQASEGESTGGDIASDVVNIAGMASLAHGKFGKKTNANAPTTTPSIPPKGKVADEPELVHNAVEEAAESGNFKSASRQAAERGSMDRVTPVSEPMSGEPLRLTGGVQEPERGLSRNPQNGFTLPDRELPELQGHVMNGAIDPVTMQEIQRLMMNAKVRSIPRAPRRMPDDILNIAEDPMITQRRVLERIRQWEPPSGIPTGRKTKRAQMEEMYALRDAELAGP